MPSTITAAERKKIEDFIRDRYIPEGMGDREAACSIAAINLALFNQLTDNVPACMSLPLGKWIIETQDEMPEDIRNSEEWKYLLPFAAGTGRKHEEARQQMIHQWYVRKGDTYDEESGDTDWYALDPVQMLRYLVEVSVDTRPRARRARKADQTCPGCMAAA